MALPTITFSELFNLSVSPQVAVSTDTTDYASYGIDLADVQGNFTITAPSPVGNIHNNTSWVTPDIEADVDLSYSQNLPSDGEGGVVPGLYTFAYNVRIHYEITAVTGDEGFENQMSIDSGFGDVTDIFSVGAPFTISAGGNAGNYTVLSSSFDGTNTIVLITTTFPIQNGAVTIDIYKTIRTSQQFTVANPTIDMLIEQTYDCSCSVLTSRDLTNYNIVIDGVTYTPDTTTRVHTVSAPLGENGLPVATALVTSLATATVTPIWTKTWTTTIVTTTTYTVGDYTLTVSSSSSKAIIVSCSTSLCCSLQCMENIKNKYLYWESRNPQKAEEYRRAMVLIDYLWMLYSIASNCGQTTKKAEYLAAIIDAVKNTDCECCNEETATLYPVQITPVCGAISANSTIDTYVVATCGNGITVTTTTVGTTTTYTLCLNTDLVDSIIEDYLIANPLALSDLSDVNITSIVAGQTLVWSGTEWQNANLALDDLSNVSVPSPTTNYVLTWNGSAWVAAATQATSPKAWLLASTADDETRTTTGAYTANSCVIAATTSTSALGADGDTVVAELLFEEAAADTGDGVGLYIGGTLVLTGFGFAATTATVKYTELIYTIQRVSNTTLRVRIDGKITAAIGTTTISLVNYVDMGGLNLSTSGVTLAPYLTTASGSAGIILRSSIYKSYKK